MIQRKNRRTLTRVERIIMETLWEHGPKGMTTHQIVACCPDPKPAYSTISTHMKILTEKEMVKPVKDRFGSKAFRYIPLISRLSVTMKDGGADHNNTH